MILPVLARIGPPIAGCWVWSKLSAFGSQLSVISGRLSLPVGRNSATHLMRHA